VIFTVGCFEAHSMDKEDDIKAFHTAIYWGYINIVKYFLENGVNVNAHYKKISPLIRAIQSNEIKVVKLLISKNAEPSEEAVKFAKKYGHKKIQRLLLKSIKIARNGIINSQSHLDKIDQSGFIRRRVTPNFTIIPAINLVDGSHLNSDYVTFKAASQELTYSNLLADEIDFYGIVEKKNQEIGLISKTSRNGLRTLKNHFPSIIFKRFVDTLTECSEFDETANWIRDNLKNILPSFSGGTLGTLVPMRWNRNTVNEVYQTLFVEIVNECIYLNLGNYQLYAHMLSISEWVFGPVHDTTLKIQLWLAKTEYERGIFPETLIRIQELLQKVKSENVIVALETRILIVEFLGEIGKHNEAIVMCREIIDEINAAGDDNHILAHKNMLNYASELIFFKKYDDALKLVKVTLENYKEEFDYLTVRALELEATIYSRLNKPDIALKTLKRKEEFPSNWRSVLETRKIESECYVQQRRFAKAQKAYCEILSLYDENGLKNHPEKIIIKMKLGDLHFNQRKYYIALEIYTEICERVGQVFGNDSQEVKNIQKNVECARRVLRLKKSDIERLFPPEHIEKSIPNILLPPAYCSSASRNDDSNASNPRNTLCY